MKRKKTPDHYGRLMHPKELRKDVYLITHNGDGFELICECSNEVLARLVVKALNAYTVPKGPRKK